MKKKIKSGNTVLVSVHGKIEVGVIQKTYTKKGIQYFDVLLERGSFLKSITSNTEYPQHVIEGTKKITASIDVDKYNYDIADNNKYSTPLIFEE